MLKLNKRFIRNTVNRLSRKAQTKGVSITDSSLQYAARLLEIRHDHYTVGVWSYNGYDGPDFNRITYAQLARQNGDRIKNTLVRLETVDTYTEVYPRIWLGEDRIAYIDLASRQYGADMVYQSNYDVICGEYKDLLAYGIITDENQKIGVYVDRPYHDQDRLQEFYDLVSGLQNYIIADEDHYSNMTTEAEYEYIKGELRYFVRALDVHDDLEFLFDNDLITDDTLINHIFSLINEHNLEFEHSDSVWIDTEKIARLSPLYQLGYKIDNRVSEVIDKITTTAIIQPSLSSVLTQIIADLSSVVYDNAQPQPTLAY